MKRTPMVAKAHPENPYSTFAPRKNRMKAKGAKGKRNETPDTKWSREVRERDGETCQFCGRPATCAHHLYEKSNYPELRHVLVNGIGLCAACHVPIAHGKGLAKFRSWWASMSPEFAILRGTVGEKKAIPEVDLILSAVFGIDHPAAIRGLSTQGGME